MGSFREPWVHAGNVGLLTDLYELTMLEAYLEEGLDGEAVFDLFSRRLSPHRNYLLACGLGDVLDLLETLRIPPEGIDYLDGLGTFSPKFLRWLENFRFSGDVWAVPEGIPVFANEPILEVIAPLPEAQLVETILLNQIHVQTLAASKASRVVTAAAGRSVVDFGLRRMHGADAGIKAARAFHVAGVDGTSNVLAGALYGIPVKGTMAHSYVQAHDDELDAFRRFVRTFPDTILLVDTYDTLEGVDRVIRLARELGDAFRVRGIRLDSGDLAALARGARERLDAAGLEAVSIFASSSLDEHEIARLVRTEAPIDAFGVGTRMGVSEDDPSLDLAYKLVAYAGEGRIKLSSEKVTFPGRKQVFRVIENSIAVRDVLALHNDRIDGEPLLHPAMRQGRRLVDEPVDDARRRAARELARLPDRCRRLEPADPPYPVEISDRLRGEHDRLTRAHR